MNHSEQIRNALRLAKRAYGFTSPNPMVGAVLVKRGQVIGRGWHHRAGEPHAEIEALRDAARRGHKTNGATLYVTLEPCCTHGRTPPCTSAIVAAGIREVVVGATDPNPKHAGQGFELLKRAGIKVISGILAEECSELNEAFNHWIVNRTPFVTVKAAMSLDGKIATSSGESKWITGPAARKEGMRLRLGSDAILAGINTVLADDPSLTWRPAREGVRRRKTLHRVILDSQARTPLNARLVSDSAAALTTVVVSASAPGRRIAALEQRVKVWISPEPRQRVSKGDTNIDLGWLLRKLGSENVTSLLVEGGGEANASFLFGGHAHRIAFFYAPKILGGSGSRKAAAGLGASSWNEVLMLEAIRWRQLGPDLMLTARVLRR